MKTTPCIIALTVLVMTAALVILAPPLGAQTGRMPNLIDPNLNPRVSEHMTDNLDPQTFRGRWTGLSGDMIYVDHAPFRITPTTTMVAEGGFSVTGLVFEEDKTIEVQSIPDKATGEEGVPLAVYVRIYPGQMQ